MKSGYDGFAASGLDFGFGRSGELAGRDLEGTGELTVAEHFHEGLTGADNTGLGKHLCVDLGHALVETSEITDIQNGRLSAEVRLVEAAVRQTTIKGHLATFKADPDTAAGTSRLALTAATGGLTVAAAFAAADTLPAVHGTSNILEFVEFHFGFLNGRPDSATAASGLG